MAFMTSTAKPAGLPVLSIKYVGGKSAGMAAIISFRVSGCAVSAAVALPVQMTRQQSSAAGNVLNNFDRSGKNTVTLGSFRFSLIIHLITA
jgi:hypothetical protein